MKIDSNSYNHWPDLKKNDNQNWELWKTFSLILKISKLYNSSVSVSGSQRQQSWKPISPFPQELTQSGVPLRDILYCNPYIMSLVYSKVLSYRGKHLGEVSPLAARLGSLTVKEHRSRFLFEKPYFDCLYPQL